MQGLYGLSLEGLLGDLFALVTIVALALGWAVDHWRMASLRAENRLLQFRVGFMQMELEELGRKVTMTEDGMSVKRPDGTFSVGGIGP